MSSEPTVFLVDDDQAVLVALTRMLRLENYPVQCWTAARDFLSHHDPDAPGCLICDFAMPAMSGLELQRELLHRGWRRPIIFLTGNADVRLTARAARLGSVIFLSKPVMRSELLRAVKESLRQDDSQGPRSLLPGGPSRGRQARDS